MAIDKALVILVISFTTFILLDNLSLRKKKGDKKGNTDTTRGSEEKKDSSEGGMVEYSRETSQEFGFNKGKGYIRPSVLKRKGLTKEEEIQLDKLKLKDEKFSNAMKEYITLKEFKTKENLKNKTIRVFIDTINDTRVLVRDDTAILELQLGKVFDMAGEFVLINLNKEGERITVNYVISDN